MRVNERNSEKSKEHEKKEEDKDWGRGSGGVGVGHHDMTSVEGNGLLFFSIYVTLKRNQFYILIGDPRIPKGKSNRMEWNENGSGTHTKIILFIQTLVANI